MVTAPVHQQRAFPEGRRRRADAEQWLGELLQEWQLQSASTGRWLAAAQDTLDSPGELVLSVQYDPDLLLFTLEIRRAGRAVYGIDDWLGRW